MHLRERYLIFYSLFVLQIYWSDDRVVKSLGQSCGMSSRALRKAQRERDQQERLQQLEFGTDVEDGDEDVVPNPTAKKSAFAMLDMANDDAVEDGNSDQNEADELVTIGDQSSLHIHGAATRRKKQKKKKKKKEDQSGDSPAVLEDSGKKGAIDEIDAALKELSTKHGDSAQSGLTASGVDAAQDEVSQLLSIDTNHLHAQNEMRRLFGRAALEQQDDDGAPAENANLAGNRRQQRQQAGLAQALRRQQGQGGRSGGLASLALRRNIFIEGKEEWPLATGGGLGMEVAAKRQDGTVEYRYIHSRAYQDIQSQFQSCVASMDPNRLVVLLQHNPYHISTLLQVSEIARTERDHTTSGDLLERALFSLGRSVHSTFAKSISEGRARLDFRRPENREFWLASWRHMQNLSMRGTWRTVYEWAKLLLSLAPDEDPYAIWMVLDQYALRSRQDLDYINLSRNPSCRLVHKDMPNVQLSQGLAEFRSGNRSKGQQALFIAISRHPWVVFRLMRELGLDAPPAIWGMEPRTDRERLYSELYTVYAKDLWNIPEASALLTEIASAVPPEAQQAEPETGEITLNEARHVLLSDTPTLISLVPRKYTAQLTSSSDPLPPAYSIASYSTNSGREIASPYLTNLSTATESLSELQSLYRFFGTLFPWFDAQRDPSQDGAGEVPYPSQEEMEDRIRGSGVDENVIVQRTHRMMELQRHLLGEDPEGVRFPDSLLGDLQARTEGANDGAHHANSD